MTIRWLSETPCLFSATLATSQGRRFLVVEELPDGGWDWVTWGQGRQTRPLHGTAVTARLAMSAASRAAWIRSIGSVHFLPLPNAPDLHS